MIQHPDNRTHYAEVDSFVFKVMRASTLQEIINALLPDDAPQNFINARKAFLSL